MCSHEESFGIVLIEAGSFGVPQVAFDSAQGAHEIIKNNRTGYLIQNRNKKEFATKAHELLNDRKKQKEIVELEQIEQGSTVTPYEPYKSNILTVNEPVELRGIGDVKDTLDLMTGEMTERICEIVLDGSENWAINNTQATTTNMFILNGVIKSDMTDETLSWYMVDKLPKTKWSDSCQLGITITNGKIFLYNNSIEYNISALKSWLSQNPITVQYQLNTESVKTVDLSCINEDNVECDFIPIMDTMHYQTSSDTITPLVDLTVFVEATTQNLASFIKLEGVEHNE